MVGIEKEKEGNPWPDVTVNQALGRLPKFRGPSLTIWIITPVFQSCCEIIMYWCALKQSLLSSKQQGTSSCQHLVQSPACGIWIRVLELKGKLFCLQVTLGKSFHFFVVRIPHTQNRES